MVPRGARRTERGVWPGCQSTHVFESLESVACDPPRLVANRLKYIIARRNALNLMYFESHCFGMGPVYVMVGCGWKSAGREPVSGMVMRNVVMIVSACGDECSSTSSIVVPVLQARVGRAWWLARPLRLPVGASKSTGKRALHSWGVVGF